jgi:DNA-binding CsgD family transcriptional regulator
VDERTWLRSVERNEVFQTVGVDHAVYCFRPVPGAGDEVAGAILTRAAGEPDFTTRGTAIVQEAFAVLGPLVGGPLARFAEPSPSALPPRCRQVLRCLLEGDGDKQVAARLGLSRYTVNEYTKRVYRHFGVEGRAELLARWVRRGWGLNGGWADPPPGRG